MIWVVDAAFGVAGVIAGSLAWRLGFIRGRLRAPEHYLGVRLRVSDGAGKTLIDVDSTQLHFMARYGAYAQPGGYWCDLWGDAFSDIRIQIKPVVMGACLGDVSRETSRPVPTSGPEEMK